MLQKLIFIGHVGREPEMRYTPAGQAVTNFSVAVNTRWTNSDGTDGERVTWYKVACWGKLAEITNQYLAKGRKVMVVASRIEAEAYIDNEGQPRAAQSGQEAKDVEHGLVDAVGAQRAQPGKELAVLELKGPGEHTVCPWAAGVFQAHQLARRMGDVTGIVFRVAIGQVLVFPDATRSPTVGIALGEDDLVPG